MSSLECAAAFIFDPRGRLFVQRRSGDRKLFPHCWDIVGGHLEPGETPDQAMRRELHEETGWQVETIHAMLGPLFFTGDDGLARREFDYVVSVSGDLERPVLEEAKHTEWRWITADEVWQLDQDQRIGDRLIVDLIRLGFERAQEIGVSPSYAAVIAPLIDVAFRDVMLTAREQGGLELRGKHGLPTAGPLIDYRTVLPGRPLTPSERDVVNRYSDPAALHEGFLEQERLGTVTVAPDGTVTVTERGMAFYQDLWELHERVASGRLADLAGLLPVPSDGGPAFSAVYPGWLPDGASDGLKAFVGLSALRYHRADAHAAAREEAGLTTAMEVGAQRDAIEARTNELAGTPYQKMSVQQRFELLAKLARPAAARSA